MSALLAQVPEQCEAGNAVSEPLPVVLPCNIASEPAPAKEDLIANHCSRFNNHAIPQQGECPPRFKAHMIKDNQTGGH